MNQVDNAQAQKIFLVTGGSSGVGKATAIAIAQRGGKVVIVSRDKARGQAALAEISRRAGNKLGELLLADLSLQSSVRALAAEFKQRYNRLDGLLNLAGAFYFKQQTTSEGIDQSLAVNYLSHFLLTNELLDILEKTAGSRVITVGGNPMFLKQPKLDLEALQGHKKYSSMQAAAQAMFARVHFAFELARRLQGKQVSSIAFNPGVIKSNLTADAPFLMKLLAVFYKPFEKDVCEVGGWLATDPSIQDKTGLFYDDKKREVPLQQAFSPEVGRQLWTLSETLIAISKA